MISNTLLTNIFCISDDKYDKDGYLLIYGKDLRDMNEDTFTYLWHVFGMDLDTLSRLIPHRKYKYRKIKFIPRNGESFIVKPIV